MTGIVPQAEGVRNGIRDDHEEAVVGRGLSHRRRRFKTVENILDQVEQVGVGQ